MIVISGHGVRYFSLVLMDGRRLLVSAPSYNTVNVLTDSLMVCLHVGVLIIT